MTALETLPSERELAEELGRSIGWIQTSQEATAHLEASGLTDDDALLHYGARDLFELGERVLLLQQQAPELRAAAASVERQRVLEEADRDRHKIQVFRSMLRGVAYGMPMFLSVFASLFLLYSLWSYYYFTPADATAVGLGTALSYFTAGGLTQAIGRRGLTYLRQGLYLMTLRVSLFFIGVGVVMTMAMAVVMYMALSTFSIVSQPSARIAVLYFCSLSTLWLCLALLYMLERELMFSLGVALGIGVVHYLREYQKWDIIWAHQVGIAFTAVFALAASSTNLLWLHRRHRDPNVPLYAVLPRTVMLLSTVRTYVLYGTLYFLLLFLDRMLSWTGRMEFRQTFVWFRADYEAGLNWALLAMLPAFTVLEIVLQRFSGQMKPRQLSYSLTERATFSTWFRRFYLRQVLLYLLLCAAGVLAAYFGMLWLTLSVPELAVIRGDVARFSFALGVVGYLAIGLSLLNLSVFFWLSRPRLAMVSLVPAIAADFVVGYVLSRTVDFSYSCVGLAVGGLVFALVSTVLCLRVMSNLDFYYYSAF